MSRLYIITSSINPREDKLTYSRKRSLFDKESRLQQTVFTIKSIQSMDPGSRMILLDSSDDLESFQDQFLSFYNLEVYSTKKFGKEIHDIIASNRNKSACECLMLGTYLETNRVELLQYDHIVKTTGRYVYSDFSPNILNEYQRSKFFFKKELKFKWNDIWKYELVDSRSIDNDNYLHQYCTVLYAFGIENLERMIDIYTGSFYILNHPDMIHYDIETLSNYFLRPYKSDMIEVPWTICGFDGVNGNLMHY